VYEGGLNSFGFPCDICPLNQRNSLQLFILFLLRVFPLSKVIDHRELRPDLDAGGVIFALERLKEYPFPDVKTAL
jgi:N-acetylmuramoyl-L-alanine amidase